MLPAAAPVLRILEIAATVILGAAFGYGLNDIADRASDARAGKLNRAAGLGRGSLSLFLILTAGGAFALSLAWARDPVAPALVLLALGLAVAYSVPPLRLKERGRAALFGAAAAQWAVPVLAISAAEPGGELRAASWLFALLSLAIGTRWIAMHQLVDAPRDRRAAVRTYASQGSDVNPVLRAALGCELVLLAAALASTWPRIAEAAIALAIYCVWIMHLVWRRRPLLAGLGFHDAPLADYYFCLLPAAVALQHLIARPRSPEVAALLLVLALPHLVIVIRRRQSRGQGARTGAAIDWPRPQRAAQEELDSTTIGGSPLKRASASMQRPVVSASEPHPHGPP
jgi:4-hydroxybenzoate polyprenyltransferase